MHAIKRLKNKTITVVLALAIALSFLIGIDFSHKTALAEDDVTEFPPTSVGISNPQFDSSSGSYPAVPSSWTGAAADGGSGRVISGVVDLSDAYFGKDSGNEKFELDQYPEYADDKNKPQTIFGEKGKYKGTDEKALLINTAPGAEIAYSYKSSDMSFSPNSFYRVSAWVKTGDFAPDTGATIKLTGLGENCSFMNINTVKDIEKANGIPVLTADNDYGWVKYTFYVRTSASYTRTVNLLLGVGDSVKGDDEDPDVMPRAAKGYAFFDTVDAERISAHDFATETLSFELTDKQNVYANASGTAMALDLYEPISFTAENGKEIGTFSQNTELWDTNVFYDEYGDNNDSTGVAHSSVYSSESRITDFDSDDNIHGFTQNPWSPLGRAEYETVAELNPMFDGAHNADIMMINTYDGNRFQSAAYGIGSPTVKIDRFKYYRFGVWVKGDSVEGSSGISILVKGKRNGASNFKTLSSYSGLNGDSTDNAHYGWKEQVVYIRGSMLYEYDVKFELWLGTPSSKASGIALFDNVTFTELKYSEYTGMSGADGGNVLTIDQSASDTGINNGNFKTVGDIGDLENPEFPLPVADWTFVTPDTAETTGFSKEKVNTDNAVHGILPTDDDMFSQIQASGAIPGVKNPAHMYSGLENVLLLSSTTPTAIGYKSTAFTLTSGQGSKVTVDLAVDGVTSGNGAALILKTSTGGIVSAIQNIKTTNGAFKTFTFYLDAPRSNQTLVLELWLGTGDRNKNASNLSNGNVYVRNVGMTEWTIDEGSTIAAEYAKIAENYKTAITTAAMRDALDYAVYSFSAPTFDYYDIYSYASNSGFGIPYQWSRSSANGNVISGIFNTADMKDLTVYDGFDKKDQTGTMLYIFNTDINRTTYTCDNTITLEANKYYRLDVTAKVRVTDEVRKDETSIGANLRLTGTTAEFANIKDTTTVIAKDHETDEDILDYETFKTFSFFISTGDNGGDVGLEITFGGADRSGYIQGKLIIADIAMNEVDNLDYEDAEKDTDNDYVTAVALSDTAEDEDDDNTEAPSSEIQWWILPTVIFGVALLGAVIVILVFRIRDRIKKKHKVTYTAEYDRSDTIRDIERLQAEQDSDKAKSNALPQIDATRNELDDDDYKPEPDEQPTETEAEQTAEQSDSTENAGKETAEKSEEPAAEKDDDLDD